MVCAGGGCRRPRRRAAAARAGGLRGVGLKGRPRDPPAARRWRSPARPRPCGGVVVIRPQRVCCGCLHL